MQLRMNWKLALLSGALLVGACSKKEPAPAPETASAPKPEQAPAPAEESATTPEPSGSPEEAEAVAPDDGKPPEFTLGQSRAELMRLFGSCAERRAFEPPGPGKLYVEIYQAKDTEACRKRLGERQFTIRGGTLFRITPGLIPPEPPPKEPPEGV
ncbi:hypothetical protein [Hyalangium sp.]|uniref:hypothetical protein n=1 Tax=Hyalangium sp. TaxID=2028555 RepID=UPI002D6C67ED|nr:hypothetical protein [Hyalangium sp.]HYH94325.1 hypothetical protein [Hyalangium sp.]